MASVYPATMATPAHIRISGSGETRTKSGSAQPRGMCRCNFSYWSLQPLGYLGLVFRVSPAFSGKQGGGREGGTARHPPTCWVGPDAGHWSKDLTDCKIYCREKYCVCLQNQYFLWNIWSDRAFNSSHIWGSSGVWTITKYFDKTRYIWVSLIRVRIVIKSHNWQV